ncbi:MAG: dethiobiotin synthase [Myxococcota bacterium]
MRGIFVVGTDTGVGKTLVCAALMAAGEAGLRYWKPVQTGALDDDDTETVRRLARLGPERLIERGVRLRAPASPHHAAALEGQELRLEPLLAIADGLAGPVVVEGAGGLLVPISATLLLPDLIRALALPVLVVGATRLGTINHTLLTLAELRRQGLQTLGLVLSGPPDPSVDTALAAHARDLPIHSMLPMDLGDFEALGDAGRGLVHAPQIAAQLRG